MDMPMDMDDDDDIMIEPLSTWMSEINGTIDDSYRVDLSIDEDNNYLVVGDNSFGRFSSDGMTASFDITSLRQDDEKRIRSFSHEDKIYRFYSYRSNRASNPRIFLEIIGSDGQIIESMDLPPRYQVYDLHVDSERVITLLVFHQSLEAMRLMKISLDDGVIKDIIISRNQSTAPSDLHVAPDGTYYLTWPGTFRDYQNFFRVSSDFDNEFQTTSPLAIYDLTFLSNSEIAAVGNYREDNALATLLLNTDGEILSETRKEGYVNNNEFRSVHSDSLIFTQEWQVEQVDQMRITCYDMDLNERVSTFVNGYIGFSPIVLNEFGGVSFYHGTKADDDSSNPRLVKMAPDCIVPETIHTN